MSPPGLRDLGRVLVGLRRAHEHRLARLAAQLRRELEVRVAQPEISFRTEVRLLLRCHELEHLHRVGVALLGEVERAERVGGSVDAGEVRELLNQLLVARDRGRVVGAIRHGATGALRRGKVLVAAAHEQLAELEQRTGAQRARGILREERGQLLDRVVARVVGGRRARRGDQLRRGRVLRDCARRLRWRRMRARKAARRDGARTSLLPRRCGGAAGLRAHGRRSGAAGNRSGCIHRLEERGARRRVVGRLAVVATATPEGPSRARAAPHPRAPRARPPPPRAASLPCPPRSAWRSPHSTPSPRCAASSLPTSIESSASTAAVVSCSACACTSRATIESRSTNAG